MADSSNRQKDIFLKALDLFSADERAAYLTEACEGDDALRRQIDAMLQAHGKPDSFLEKPAAALELDGAAPDPEATRSAPDQPSERPGGRIGPYKLLQQIGAGGMGVVYMAEQEQPVRRRVALKVIKPGMDSTHVIARFRAEQQALALMDHQNIAKVFDAGTTDTGRPYFVMELVHGVPITQYCDDNKLTPRERLELFVPVCRAVQHAHQKGIIHRDLKPSNVLVCMYDSKPVAKVIDFGVAKAMEQPLTEYTMFTQFGQVVGTLEYMSPEQAQMNQLGIDTRSDIYSLGVMMYELLTGSTPLQKHRVRKAALDEILKLIREEEPPAPSSRLSSSTETLPQISAQRRTEPARLTKLVRGELDWIVMKSLEKDRTRRYDSASGMAQDIERYLADEPVEACPPSATYRLRKYAHKHRVLLTTVAAFALILVVGTGVSVWQAIEATNAKGDAEKARANATKDRDKAVQAKVDLDKSSERLRRVLYASDMNLVSVAWDQDQPERALDLLERHRPKAGQSDLRGLEWHYWQRRFRTEARTVQLEGFDRHFLPHLSASGRRCVRAFLNADGGVDLKVWDTTTGRMIRAQLVEPPSKVGQVHSVQTAFSPDESRLLLFRGGEGPLSAWSMIEIASGKTQFQLDDLAVRFHPDGKHLVAWKGRSSALVLRDAATGEEVRTLTGDSWWIPEFSASSTRVAFAFAENDRTGRQIRVVETATGNVVGKVLLPSVLDRGSFPPQFLLMPDGKRLAIGPMSTDFAKEKLIAGRVTFWDVETGKLLWSHAEPPDWLGYDLVPSPDGRHLVLTPYTAGLADPTRMPILIETETGKTEAPLYGVDPFLPEQSIEGIKDPMLNSGPFSGDGRLLVSHNYSSSGLRVTTVSGQRVFECKFPFGNLRTRFTADGRHLLAVDENGTNRFWEIGPWLPLAATVAELRQRSDNTASPGDCLVDTEGTTIVSLQFEKAGEILGNVVLKTFDSHTRKVLRSFGPYPRGHVLTQMAGVRWACLYNPANHQVRPLAPDERSELRIVDLESGREVVLWKASKDYKAIPTGRTTPMIPLISPNLVFHPDGLRVLLMEFEPAAVRLKNNSARLTLMNLTEGAKIESWLNRQNNVVFCRWTPDGKKILLLRYRDADRTAGAREALLADTETGEVAWKIADIGHEVSDGEVSPDGRRILLSGTNGAAAMVQIFDAQSGKLQTRLATPGSNPYAHFRFSHDGTRVLATQTARTSGGGAIRVWDAEEGHELGLLSAHPVSANRLKKDSQRFWGLRGNWHILPPGQALEVIDATPLPADLPAKHAKTR